MSNAETTALAVNSFCWVDLVTPDAAGARKFYTDLFGWDVTEFPTPAGAYTMFQKDGAMAAGMVPVGHTPGYWASYVKVASVAEAAKQVVALGGRITEQPSEMAGMGRMASAEDPTGVAFRLWEPFQEGNKTNYNTPGNLAWNELLSSDTEKAKAFYTRLFHWQPQERNLGPMAYTQFDNAGRPAAGMMSTPPGAPASWVVYFAVANCDQTVTRAESLGAHVMKPATDIPTVGRFAVLIDPQGVAFAVIQL